MFKKRLFSGILPALLFAVTLILLAGCQSSPTGPNTPQSSSDQQAMLKAVDSDSAIASFEPNYNEDQAMNILGKTATAIYPLKVGQKMRMVSRNFTYTMSGDTAYGTLSNTFEGVLYIVASYDSTSRQKDTVIQKPFTTVITRNIIFVRTGDTTLPQLKWRIAAISLPEGGTLNSNVVITKVTVFLSSGDTLVVTDPNSYYLSRGLGWWRAIPHIDRNKPVTVQVEISSAYADTDFVTLTNGGDLKGMHREKMKFDLISSTPNGNGYDKVYQQTFITHQWPGYFHAVINAFPKQVITDDSTPVESNSWGIPYFVKW